jgi:glycosyltransferase involved in cell wall biosynthesis
MANTSWLAIPYRVFGDYWRFWAKVRSTNYDLVHINPSLGREALIRDGFFLMLATAAGRTAVVFFRGWDLELEKRLRQRWLDLFRRTYFRASAFIVLAEEFRHKLIELGCTRPIFLETTTVDDSVFAMQARSETKSQDTSTFNILFLASVEISKGIYETVQAYRLIKAEFPNVTLTIAGDGVELDNVQAYVATHQIDDVCFAGHVCGHAKQQAFMDADCYLLPSHNEGLPNSVLEAMAYGLPIVTRLVGGLRDLMRNELVGLATESRQPEAFAQLIRILIQDPALRLRMRQHNTDYALRHFKASDVATRLKRIYAKIIERKGEDGWYA